MIVLFLFLASCSEKKNSDGLQMRGLTTQWSGYSAGDYIYYITDDGLLNCLNIYTNRVEWETDTGGPIINYTSNGGKYYVPSIDGFLYQFSPKYGYRRVIFSIRDLAYMSPLMTETGEVFQSETSTTILVIDQKTGEIITTKSAVQFGENINMMSDTGYLYVVRIDYILNIAHSNTEIIQSTEFDIINNDMRMQNTTDRVSVQYFAPGGLTVSVNDTIVTQTSISKMPIKVFGFDREFEHALYLSNEKLPKHKVAFVNLRYGPLAIPAKKQKNPSKYETLLVGLSALTGREGPESDRKFGYGLHDIRKPFAIFKQLSPNPNNKYVEPIKSRHLLFFENFMYKGAAAILFTACILLRIIQYSVGRTVAAEKMTKIRIDKHDPNLGYYGDTSISIISVEGGVLRDNFIEGLRAAKIPHTPVYYGSITSNGTLKIGYQKVVPYTKEGNDITSLAKVILETLQDIHAAHLCHTHLDESVLYHLEDDDSLLIGGLEWSCEEYSEVKAANDIYSVGVILSNLVDDSTKDRNLVLDLVSDMMNEDMNERPTASEALEHPLFFNAIKRIGVFTDLQAILYDNAFSQELLHKFEENKLAVMQTLSWDERIPNALVADLNSKNSYEFDSLRELVRMIRNKFNHRNEIKDKNLSDLNSEDTFFDFFDVRFPNLFLYCYYFRLACPSQKHDM